jgi:peptidyl-prolyl cis-trans isomerase B (cyclophilin B)
VAGKKERQRRLARERYERRAVRRAQRYQRTRRWTAIGSVCLLVVALAAGGFFLFRGHGQHAQAAATKPAAGATPTPATPSPTPTPTQAEPAKHCTYTSNPPAARNVGMPPARPDYKAKYQATIHTNRGDIVINLRNSKATCTVNSFVFLAAKKYFNNTHCQRLTTSGYFVLQCGDPTGTGSGGPGYKFDDENLAGAKYPAGTVAMANNRLPTPTAASSSSSTRTARSCNPNTRRLAPSSADSISSRMWPRRAATTPTVPVTVIRRRRSSSRA